MSVHVLQLQVQRQHEHLCLVEQLGNFLGGTLGHYNKAWPAYAAYAVSFLTIGIMWANHNAMFEQIGRVDRTFLMLNIALIFGKWGFPAMGS